MEPFEPDCRNLLRTGELAERAQAALAHRRGLGRPMKM